MPTYQYACTNSECGNRFELVQSFTDPAASECPVCGSPVRKVFSAVGVVFKGSGFYRNDSRSGSHKSESTKSESSKSESNKSDSAKSESSKSESTKSESSKSDSGTSGSNKTGSSASGKSDTGSSSKAAAKA